MDHLWYGDVYVLPKDAAPPNHLGVDFGVGGTYNTNKDVVTVYADPKPFITELLVHELGHRYYYRFMRQKDRMRFSSMFNFKTVKIIDEGVIVEVPHNPDLMKELARIATLRETKRTNYGTTMYEYLVPKPKWSHFRKLARRHNLTPSTTKYGSTVPAEDFAEVFMSYVMGQNTDRAPVERLKYFLGAQRAVTVAMTRAILKILNPRKRESPTRVR